MIPYTRNGKRVTREEFDATARRWPIRRGRRRNTNVPGLGAYRSDSPLVSQTMGCMPSQVGELREAVKAAGLSGVDVRNDGAVELSCRGDRGRRGLMKMLGVFDQDGGYGDG